MADDTALVCGSSGLAGSAIAEALRAAGWRVIPLSSRDADLRDLAQVRASIEGVRPALLVHSAGRVGGIEANRRHGAQLGLDNALLAVNVLKAALELDVSKLIYLGSGCCYPNDRTVKMGVDDLFAGTIESSSRAYALAKSLGIELVLRARSDGMSWTNVIPANLYGPRDNFDLQGAHVVAALLRRFHDSKELGEDRVVLWGSGAPRRQFLHSADLASSIALLADQLDAVGAVVNVGGDDDCSIADLADAVALVAGFDGTIAWDASHADGTSVKLLDDAPLRALGWEPSFHLLSGLRDTYGWFIEAIEAGAARGYPGSAATSSAPPAS